MKPPLQLIGQRFGRLLVQERTFPNQDGYTVWRCLCDCGKSIDVRGRSLACGNTRSCGCLYLETMRRPRTHGKSRSRVHRIWAHMIQRCTNPNRPDYHCYGGRGITVCDKWREFSGFYTDMGDPPPRLTIERIDNNGNYEPGNCRWASRKEQRRNTRTNIIVQLFGRQMPLVEACEALGKKHQNVYMRMRRGASFEEAIQ